MNKLVLGPSPRLRINTNLQRYFKAFSGLFSKRYGDSLAVDDLERSLERRTVGSSAASCCRNASPSKTEPRRLLALPRLSLLVLLLDLGSLSRSLLFSLLLLLLA